MEILWLAIVIYTVGLAAALHLRPALMFNENGTWKEFGYNRSTRHTLFPFWLFSIVWAFVSYAIAAAFTWRSAGVVISASAIPHVGFEEDVVDDDFIPASRYRRQTPYPAAPPTYYEPPADESQQEKKPRPGYYMLEPSEDNGLRRYVYYGSSPPPASALPLFWFARALHLSSHKSSCLRSCLTLTRSQCSQTQSICPSECIQICCADAYLTKILHIRIQHCITRQIRRRIFLVTAEDI